MGIDRKQALDCFASPDLIGIGMEADAVRRHLHPDGVVSYVIDREIDASLDPKIVFATIAEVSDLGDSGISLRATSKSASESLEGLIADIKRRFPAIWVSVAASAVPAIEDLERFRDAGLDSLSGGDEDSDRWFEVHRAAHKLGMKTTASMTFGGGETADQRVQHLERLHQLQQETGGFAAFVPRVFHATGNGWDEATAVECLKTLAVGRMYLDSIDNVQASGPLKVLQMGLRFGGNDVGSVARETGSNAATEEELRRIIRDAGFRPVQRDTLYRTMFLD